MVGLVTHGMALHETLGLGEPIRDEAHYAQTLAVAEALMADVAALEAGPLGGLVQLLADRIREYEDRVHPWPVQPLAPMQFQTLAAQGSRARGLALLDKLDEAQR